MSNSEITFECSVLVEHITQIYAVISNRTKILFNIQIFGFLRFERCNKKCLENSIREIINN